MIDNTKLINIINLISQNLNLDERSKNELIEIVNRNKSEISEEQLLKLNELNESIRLIKTKLTKQFSNKILINKFNNLMTNLAKVKLQALLIKDKVDVDKKINNMEESINDLTTERNKLLEKNEGLSKNKKDSEDMISNILDMVNGTIQPISNMLEQKKLDNIDQDGGFSKIDMINKYLIYKFKYLNLKIDFIK